MRAQTAVTWSATTNGAWGTTSNWTGNALPQNSLTANYASFNLPTGVTVTTGTTQSVAGIDFGSSAGAYTLLNSSGAGKTLTLGAYGVRSASSSDQLITGSKLTLTLGAASSFLVNGTGSLTISSSSSSIATTSTNTLTLGGTGLGIGTVSSVISGGGSLTKSDSGTWTLSGINTYTGATNVNAGTLRATTSASALGAGSLTLAGGTLELANDTGLNFARNTTVSANSTVTSDRLTSGAGITHTLGTLALNASTLTVNAGSNVSANSAFGLTFGATTLSASGGVFDVANNGTGTGTLTLGALTGNVNFTKQSAGSLVFNTASTRSAGSTTLSAGTLKLGSVSGLGTTGTTLALAGGTLDLATNTTVNAYNTTVSGNATILSDKLTAASAGITHTLGTLAIGSQTLSIASGGNVSANSAYGLTFGATTLNGNASFDVANNGTANGTLTLGALNDAGSADTITKSGAGVLTLGTAATSLVNGTAVNITAGTLNSNNATALGSLANVTLSSGATFSLGASQTVGALNGTSGTASLGANILTIGNATNNLTSSFGGAITGTGGITKAGTNNLTLSGTNTYSGATNVTAGAVILTHSNALSGTGVTVTSGAALMFAQDAGSNNIAVGGVGSTISGTGLSNGGAIQNLNGTNSYAGAVTLAANSRITADTGSSFTLSGNVNGAGFALDAGGVGSTTYSGVISGTGTTFKKTDSGSVTFSGSSANTFTGAVTINDGTLNLNKTGGGATGTGNITVGDGVGGASTATLRLLQANQMSDTSRITVLGDGKFDLNGLNETIGSFAGTGTIDTGSATLITGGDNTSTTFGGTLAGNGVIQKDGTGTLTFNATMSYGGEINLAGGTLSLAGVNLTVGTLRITGNTVLDFGSSSASVLTATNVILQNGATLTITNWVDNQDFFYATNSFGGLVGVTTTPVTPDVRGVAPQNQITFTGFSNNSTMWQSYDRQITPAPEPATYGAIFLGGCLGLLGWRRYGRRQAACV